jgi:ribosome-associated protein
LGYSATCEGGKIGVNEQTALDGERLIDRIVELIQSKKGEDILVIDVRKVTSIADYFILTTGTSNVHIKAIADEVRMKMKQDDGVIPWHVEGFEALRWVLIDYVDIVVHVFDRETRSYYGIENLWKDGISKRIKTNY